MKSATTLIVTLTAKQAKALGIKLPPPRGRVMYPRVRIEVKPSQVACKDGGFCYVGV